MEIIFIILAIIAVFCILGFFMGTKGILGDIANIIVMIYRKFWLVLVIIVIAAVVFTIL